METIRGFQEEKEIPCPVCGQSTWKKSGQVKDYSVSGEWFEIKECPGCSLKATYPQPEPSELGRYYASQDYVSHSDTKAGLINKLFHWARSIMMRRKHQWVTENASKSKGSLLDVGAGTGYFAKYMQDEGWDVTALEPDSTARKVAAEKLGIKIEPLEELGQLKENSFDVITLWHVLEHVMDLNGYMEHFRKLLVKDGILVIAVPNHTSSDGARYKEHWAAYDVPRHLWHFSPKAMSALLSKHGFSLAKKIPMPLDAFYVSMLSEKYRDNRFFGPAAAFISGIKTLIAEKKDVTRASSLIYISR